jgi:hypothetical protein
VCPGWRLVGLKASSPPPEHTRLTAIYRNNFTVTTHCDSYNDERRNVVRAIQIARGLINHQECLIEELDENDRYLGSCVQRQTEPLNTLSARARRLRYVFFNEEPHIKAIDYSAYVQVKGGYWILKSAKQKIEEMHRQLGNKSPFE